MPVVKNMLVSKMKYKCHMLKAIFGTVLFRLQIYIQVVQQLHVKYLIVCSPYINRKSIYFKNTYQNM